MKCLQCQFDNPPTMKFCGGCGARLGFFCPQCGAENPPAFKFCGQCGTPLGGPEPWKEKVSTEKDPISHLREVKIKNYTPKHLANKILTARSALEGERRQVTVLFADIAGFTTLAEKLDPEVVHEIIDHCFELITAEVHRFEGTINQYTGDGVMALFGAPLAHEDSPRRAVHAALGIQRAIQDFSRELQAQRGFGLQMRIGLNTGIVVVGKIGDDLRMDYTAVGDTTNLAARLQQMARPGGVFISEATYKLVSSFFETIDLGEVQVKGHTAPVRVFEVIRARRRRTHFEIAAEHGLTPLIGRDLELATLEDRFRQVKGGQGQVVLIAGEAGIGKSRLVFELRRKLAKQGEQVTWLEGRCISFGQAIPFLPLMDQLRENFGIEEGDGEPEVIAKVEHGMRRLKELEAHIPYIRYLLSVDPGDSAILSMDPLTRRKKIFDALRALVLRGASFRPIVLVFEDLHWIDTSTEEYLSFLMDSVAGIPLMLILTYRVGYTPPFGSRSFHTTLTLHNLSETEVLTIAGHVLGTEQFPEEVKAALREKAEGVPLFVEEVTKTLLDLGILKRENGSYRMVKGITEVSVPDTIQGIIMARLDRLGEDGKRIVQHASVIGRQFLVRLLERISGLTSQLEGLLSELKALEIIYEQGFLTEPAYVFKHAVIQDVAYNSLLVKRRKELHRAVGYAIEELYQDRLEEHYEELVHHFSQGEVWEKVFHYAIKSGDKAKVIFANREAIHFYTLALEVANRLIPPPQDAQLINLYENRGQVYILLTNYESAVADFEAMLERTRHLGDRHREGEALCHLAQAHWLRFSEADLGLVQQYAQKAQEIAKETGDELILARGLTSLALVDQARGRLYEGDKKFEESLSIARNKGYKGIIPGNLVWMGAHAQWRGEFRQAIELCREGERIAQEVHDGFQELAALSFQCLAHAGLAEWDLALERLNEGMKKAKERNNKFIIARLTNSLGWFYSELGNIAQAVEYDQMGYELGRAAKVSNAEISSLINLGMDYIRLEQLDRARTLMEETLDRVEREAFGSHRWRWKIRLLVGLGQLWKMEQEPEKALQFLNQGLRLAVDTGSRKYITEAKGLRGEILLANGQIEESFRELQEALNIAQEMASPTLMWRTARLLGRAYIHHQDTNSASATYQLALNTITTLADQISNKELREVFLTSSEVASIREDFIRLGKQGA